MSVYHDDGAVIVHHGDCRAVLADMEPASVDAIVTDPPYELGFMSRSWDSAGVAFDVDTWAACLRVLKPGGHLLAFGGTRTYHRLTCAIEDAGFEIRDSLHWIYGSGFPKSLDVSKAIDKRGGGSHLATEIGAAIKTARERRGWTTTQADRHFCDGSTNWTWYEGRPRGCRPPTPETFARIVAEWPELAEVAALVAEADRKVIETRRDVGGRSVSIVGKAEASEYDVTDPATDDARRWQGFGTALKPAHEPIVLARRPLVGTVAATVLAHGAGGLNIDGCRVGTETRTTRGMSSLGVMHDDDWKPREVETTVTGRWPTNVVLSHPPALDGAGEVVGDACADGCIDGCPVAAMDAQSGVLKSGTKALHHADNGKTSGTYGAMRGRPGRPFEGDSGGASRFFPVFRYQAKAPRSERPRLADGTTHPTVKPLALMRWLVTLVTPPGGVVLDPFLGSGTTAQAATLEGFRCVGVEMEDAHLPLITARLAS